MNFDLFYEFDVSLIGARQVIGRHLFSKSFYQSNTYHLPPTTHRQLPTQCVRSCLEHCPYLRALSVRRCAKLRGSEAAWHWLDPAERESQLTALNLSHCHALRDGFVDLVARCGRGLKTLELAGCKRLTDNALRSIAAGAPALVALDLGAIKSISVGWDACWD